MRAGAVGRVQEMIVVQPIGTGIGVEEVVVV